MELPKLLNTGFSDFERKGCNYKFIFSFRGNVSWLKGFMFCSGTFSSEEQKASPVPHHTGYILISWMVLSSAEPQTAKERLTPALRCIPHNDAEKKQDFSHTMCCRLNPCTQQKVAHFFPGEFQAIIGMPVKLSKANTQRS